ncbi:hypothetical protein TWF281_006286 [Arthrobotrys megalospora]
MDNAKPRSTTSGIAAASSLEPDDPFISESHGTKHDKLVLNEQGLPTTLASFETPGGLRAAGQLGGISSTALISDQSEDSKVIDSIIQLSEPGMKNELSNAPHLSSKSKKRARKRTRGNQKAKKAAPPNFAKGEPQVINTTSPAPCDQILPSAVHGNENESKGETSPLADDREFTRAVGRAITNFQQNFPTIDMPLPRISQRPSYEVVTFPATKSLLKKKLSPASRNLLNFEKGGALSSDYHVYTVRNTGIKGSPVLYTAIGSLGDNVLVIDNLSHGGDKISKKPLAPEIAFDAWLWIPPSVKPEDATTEDIKQLRLIVEQDDALHARTGKNQGNAKEP